MTASAGVAILGPLYLSFSDICIRYPLSLIHIPSNHSTASNLIALVPILFSLLSRANWPVFICSTTNLSYPIVTTYESGSNVPAILMSFPGSDSPSIIITATFGGMLLILVLLYPKVVNM